MIRISEGYEQFKDEAGEPHGSFEVYYYDPQGRVQDLEEGEDPLTPGYYWQACFPGCLPDGEPNGPFNTEEEAIADAQKGT